MKKLHVYIVLFFSLFMPVRRCAQERVYKQDSQFPFVLITNDKVQQLPVISDEEFYANSQGVVFQVGKTDIPAEDTFLSLYREKVLPWVNSKHLQLRKVFIRGAASPEGSYTTNQRLGRGRSQALLDALRRDLQFQYIEADSEISSITEDYGFLCRLMKEANDPDYALVQSIYDAANGNEKICKNKLTAAKNGTLWNRLLKTYFPQLRSARLMLWFSEPDMEHTPAPQVDLGEAHIDYLAQVKNPLDRYGKLPFITFEQPQIEEPRRHLIGVRTNLLHDFFYMPQFGMAFSPNLQLEFYPKSGHLTYNIGVTWGTNRKWEEQKFFQWRDVQLEVRRYFRGGGEFLGGYMGLYAQGGKYGIGLSQTKGWQGEGGGAGLSIGYVLPLNKRGNWRMEFMAAFGGYLTKYDPYVYGNPITGEKDGDYYYDFTGSASDFKKRNHRFTWFGPTNAGIQLTYDLIYRKKNSAKKGGNL